MENPMTLKGRTVQLTAPVVANLGRTYPAGTKGVVKMVARNTPMAAAKFGVVWTLDIAIPGGQMIQAKLDGVTVL